MKLFTLHGDLTLNMNGFTSGVATAKQEMAGMKTDMQGMADTADDTKRRMDIALGTAIGDFIGKMAGALTETVFDVMSDGTVLAGNMESLGSQLSLTFGESASSIESWAKTAKASFGLGQVAATTYAADLGDALKNSAGSQAELAAISTDLLGVAADLAAFKGLNTADAVTALLAAFRGEADPIEKFGLEMSATAMAAYAMNKGLIATKDGWSQLSEAEKDMARYSYVMEATADKQGYFAENSDKYNQQLAQMEANIEQLKLSVGESLLPVMTSLVGWFNSLFGSQEEAAQSTGDFSEGLVKSYSDIALTTSSALELVKALDELATSGEGAANAEMWNAIVKQLENSIPGIGTLIGKQTGTIQAGAQALQDYVEQWRTSAMEMARINAIQSFYNEYAAMEKELLNMQLEGKINQRMVEGMTATVDKSLSALMEQIIPHMDSEYRTSENLAFLRSDEGLQSLYDVLSSGKLDTVIEGTGMSLQTMLEAAGAMKQAADIQTMIAEYEGKVSQYPAYDAEIAEQQALLLEQQARLETLEQILAETQLPGATGDVSASGAAAATTGNAAATQKPVNVTISFEAFMDGESVSAAIVPKVTSDVMSNLDWKFQVLRKE